MKLDTRIYTNVLLTIIAALLFVLVLWPQLSVVENAYASDEQQRAKPMAVNVKETSDVLEATREIAAATNNIAKALDRLAKASERIAEELSYIATK